jgi:MFS family permease
VAQTDAEPARRLRRLRSSSTFRSFSNRNFRLYYGGQLVSTAGTLMQSVGQSWLVLKLTGSGSALGLVVTLQYLPLLVLGGPAGVLIDRLDRRRLYITTQSVAAVLALVLGLLTITGTVELWMVYALALSWGIVTAVDQPVRQTFIYDMVGPEDLPNAISLQVALSSSSWAVGPALAGITIALIGIGPCFLVNSASYVVGIGTLLAMRPSELHPTPRQARRKGQFREALRYISHHPQLRSLVILTAFFFGLAWEFDVAVPLLAKFTFDGGGGLYGAMMAVIGIGAMVAGLLTARAGAPTRRRLVTSAVAVALSCLGAAVAPVLWIEMIMLPLVGGTGAVVASCLNTMVQTSAAPEMRGRVVSLWLVAALGTRPIGGPIVGLAGQVIGPRAGIALGAVGVGIGLSLWWLTGRGADAGADPVAVTATSAVARRPAPAHG